MQITGNIKTTETMSEYLHYRKVIMDLALRRVVASGSFTTRMFKEEVIKVESELGIVCETPYSTPNPFYRQYTKGGIRLWMYDRPMTYLKTKARQHKIIGTMFYGMYHWTKL